MIVSKKEQILINSSAVYSINNHCQSWTLINHNHSFSEKPNRDKSASSCCQFSPPARPTWLVLGRSWSAVGQAAHRAPHARGPKQGPKGGSPWPQMGHWELIIGVQEHIYFRCKDIDRYCTCSLCFKDYHWWSFRLCVGHLNGPVASSCFSSGDAGRHSAISPRLDPVGQLWHQRTADKKRVAKHKEVNQDPSHDISHDILW